jgi:hypothetical protein
MAFLRTLCVALALGPLVIAAPSVAQEPESNVDAEEIEASVPHEAADAADSDELAGPPPPSSLEGEEALGPRGVEQAAPEMGEKECFATDDGRLCLTRDEGADASYHSCVPLLSQPDRSGEARGCFEAVVRDAPGTAAAFRAQVALEILDEQERLVVVEEEPWIKPGRLELSAATGLFGVWNGIGLGIVGGISFPDLHESVLILGTGGAGVGLGIAGAVGGYWLAEAMDLSEGDAKLVASSLVWGTYYGGTLVPVVLDLTRFDTDGDARAGILTVIATGWVGGATGVALTRIAELDSAEVSMVNTGGWIGAIIGVLTLPNLDAWHVDSPTAMGLANTAAGTVGLAAGFGLSQMLEMTWGETLILDLGAVLGGVTTGAVVFAVQSFDIRFEARTQQAIITGALAGGLVAGWLGTAAGVALWRNVRGEPVFVWEGQPVELMPAPIVMLDSEGEMLSGFGLIGAW